MPMASIFDGDSEFDSSEPTSCSGIILIRNGSSNRSLRKKSSPPPDVPKGCLAVYVGAEEYRFVIPISYLRHALLLELLKKSEEEFGFHHEGGVHLHCSVEVFCRAIQRIESESLYRRMKIPRGPIGLMVP